MARKTTPTFVHELRLATPPSAIKVLDKRLDVGRQIYNACLGEALKRLKLMRDSKIYKAARKLPKEVKSLIGKHKPNSAIRALFNEAAELYKFREYDLHSYVKHLRSETWLSEHIDSATAQKLATRAFNAVKEYSVGARGKPRFRSINRFSSVEGKSNASGIRWQDGRVKWKGLELSVKFDKKDKHGLESHALSCPTKYVRLVRRTTKGDSIWYVQLVQEGTPYIKDKNKPGNEVVGLDIGPSTIAVVSNTTASLQAFCPDVEDYSKTIKKLQRKMSRSRRAMNPDNFEADSIEANANGRKCKKQGKVKKGAKKWVRSKTYLSLHSQVSKLSKKMKETRKKAHGELCNDILKIGTTVKTEKLSYKGFQKMFGKSAGRRAPGTFLEILRYKAVNAGGEVIEFNTRTTALSQVCQCGAKKKKKLKERWHNCPECGIKVQRDVYSAYLACFVECDRLDADQARSAWPGADILLEQAVFNLNKTAIGKARLASFGLGKRQSGSSAKVGSMQYEALDVVT